MDLLLVGGTINELPYINVAHHREIINKQVIYTSQLLGIAAENNIKFDGVIILDQGIDQSLEKLKSDLDLFCSNYGQKPVMLLTNRLELKLRLSGVTIYFIEKLRISQGDYDKFFEEIRDTKPKVQDRVLRSKPVNINMSETATVSVPIIQEKKEKRSLFSRVFSHKKSQEEDTEDKKFKYISQGISRIVGVTGHRGVGVTSTVVNLAYEASKRNLSTVIVDLDIHNRTTNIYFSEFIRQAEMDEHMNASLVKCLAKPQDYKHCACYLKDKLWLTGLTYEYEDERLLSQFYTPLKLINLITVLRQYFNLVLLDIPFEILKEFEEIIPNIDTFGLCVNNSQYSIITTLRNMGNCLSNENIGYLNAKSKLIITKYNDRVQYEGDFFTPERVSDLFASDLCEQLETKMPVAGYVRYQSNFDEQIERDIPIVESDKEFKEYYSNILLRILEGAN